MHGKSKSMSKGTKVHTHWLGFDEVGRGALAGPVVVGAVLLPRKYTWKYFALLSKKERVPLRDSKQLSHAQRCKWVAWLKIRPDIQHVCVRGSVSDIEKYSISEAANRAATRAYALLSQNIETKTARVVSDYGLRVLRDIPQEMFVRGDEHFPAIALASIVAKVHRDALMCKLDKNNKMYSFAKNKGYGSPAHIEALQRHGVSKHHRRAFVHCV